MVLEIEQGDAQQGVSADPGALRVTVGCSCDHRSGRCCLAETIMPEGSSNPPRSQSLGSKHPGKSSQERVQSHARLPQHGPESPLALESRSCPLSCILCLPEILESLGLQLEAPESKGGK